MLFFVISATNCTRWEIQCLACMEFLLNWSLVFLNILLLPFTKTLGQTYQSQNNSIGKSYERTLVSSFEILAQKWSNIAHQKKNRFLDLCDPNARYCPTALQPPTVHSEGISRGGSVTEAVCVSDMWQVTCNMWQVTRDRWHVTPDAWHVTPDTRLLIYIKKITLIFLLFFLSAHVKRFSVSRMPDFKKHHCPVAFLTLPFTKNNTPFHF